MPQGRHDREIKNRSEIKIEDNGHFAEIPELNARKKRIYSSCSVGLSTTKLEGLVSQRLTQHRL